MRAAEQASGIVNASGEFMSRNLSALGRNGSGNRARVRAARRQSFTIDLGCVDGTKFGRTRYFRPSFSRLSLPSRRRSLPSTRFQPRQALQALLSQRLRIGQMGYPVVRLNCGCEPLVLQSAFRTHSQGRCRLTKNLASHLAALGRMRCQCIDVRWFRRRTAVYQDYASEMLERQSFRLRSVHAARAIGLSAVGPSSLLGHLAPIIRGIWRLARRAHYISRVDGGGCCRTLATRWRVEAEGESGTCRIAHGPRVAIEVASAVKA